MNYLADPGRVFDSDVHRRTLGHLPTPKEEHVGPFELDALTVRMLPDADTPSEAEEIAEVLKDLEADGYASKSKDGWKMTKKGFDALTAASEED